MSGSATVVIATRNRREMLGRALDRLRALPEDPPVVVVDNASDDGTADAVAARGDDRIRVLRQDENLAAAGRTVGAAAATTPYVAFNDDDSWWRPGSLQRATAVLDAHPSVGALAARVLVGPDHRLDPVSAEMAHSPLPDRAGDLPGRAVLGFLACAVVVRRQSFLDAGGFDPWLGMGGEEALLAIDLRRRGFDVRYDDRLEVEHHPLAAHDRGGRRRSQLRNDLLVAGMRFPTDLAVRDLAAAARRSLHDTDARAALGGALARLGGVLRRRRPPPGDLAADLRLLR